ncbi:SDR family oxidoreductase [Pedobacter sp. AW31-3R]|uniref:SDR family oxidoreductase n=1 Tax=Pedobacter sp. AW31-3R TaxID=3445781 RepID=UPI003F9EE073
MEKRIYIAGCGGMLGEGFYRVFKQDYQLKCTDKDVNEKWLSYLDFRNFEKYRNDVLNFSPHYLFHLGAHTDLEFCELNIDDTYATNTLAVENAVYIANELNIPLLYISSAGIFSGNKKFYDDWDTPDPLGHYARSKYMGEKFVLQNAKRYLICRAGWMMGGGPKKDKKFINKLIMQLDEGKQELFIVNDKSGTPTFTLDFAENVKLLIEKEFWGVYNLVCNGLTDRLEVARELINLLGFNNKIKLTEVNSDYYKQSYFALRPAGECLINKKLNLRNLNIMRDWRIALRDYLDLYYLGYTTKKQTGKLQD